MKACIIGAGRSGIAAAQVLQARGIDFDCFEKGSQVGGNWRYENDNGMSSAYRSLHINTSRRVMAFKSLAMPENYPDYPDHFQMASYFDEVVDRYALRDRIRFRTEVLSVAPIEGGAGEWEVTVEGPDGRETDIYGAVLIANGHHWDARWPEPAFPGADRSRVSRSMPTNTASRRCCAASVCWCWGSATPPSTSRSSPRGSARRPSSPPAAAPGSCPST